jgi:hypothetical protein
MTRTIVVRNLATLQEVVYINDLPAERNVLNAHMQMTQKDHNWWDYDNKPHPPIEKGNVVVVCGDWCTFVDGHRFQASETLR